MKYYVYFKKDGVTICHCFEDDRKQAYHFANCVNGNVVRAY